MTPVDYRQRAKAQFDVLEQEARTQRNKFNAVVAEVKPVLDCVDLEVAPHLDGRLPRPNTIIERWKVTWENFKSFNHDAVVTAITHALAVIQSHYLAVDLQAIGTGFAKGMGEEEHQQLEDEVEDATKKLAGDIDLFGETDVDGGAR